LGRASGLYFGTSGDDRAAVLVMEKEKAQRDRGRRGRIRDTKPDVVSVAFITSILCASRASAPFSRRRPRALRTMSALDGAPSELDFEMPGFDVTASGPNSLASALDDSMSRQRTVESELYPSRYRQEATMK
jgi:hypothetical protein